MREKREKLATWVKGILTGWGYVFVLAVSQWDPANIITFTGKSQSDYDDGAKAAGYALIAAMVFAINRMPTQESPAGKLIEYALLYLEEILVVAVVVIIAGGVSLAVGAGVNMIFGKPSPED